MRPAEELVLDGNAAAGDLAALFAPDLTTLIAECGHCGAEGPLANAALFQGAGLVLRCRDCRGILLVAVRSEARLRVSLEGVRCLEVLVAEG